MGVTRAATRLPARLAGWPDTVLGEHQLLLHELADAVGGPYHALFPAEFDANLAGFQAALHSARVDGYVYYAKKANKAAAWPRACAESGAGVDVASIGELADALACGVRGEHLMVTGPAKSAELLRLAILQGCLVAVDSADELAHYRELAGRLGPGRLLLRVLPPTQPDSRFGLTDRELSRAVDVCASAPELRLEGFTCHLSGYDITERADVAATLVTWCLRARAHGLDVTSISIGGGFPVSYLSAQHWAAFTHDPADFHAGKGFGGFYPYHSPVAGADALRSALATTPAGQATTLADLLRGHDLRLLLEPGRALLDQAGCTVFRVQGVKARDSGDYGIVTVDGTSLSLSEQLFDSEFLPEPVLLRRSLPVRHRHPGGRGDRQRRGLRADHRGLQGVRPAGVRNLPGDRPRTRPADRRVIRRHGVRGAAADAERARGQHRRRAAQRRRREVPRHRVRRRLDARPRPDRHRHRARSHRPARGTGLMSFRTDSRTLAGLAVPIALTQLAQVALTTVDTVMMALISTEALAAGGLAIVLFNQLRTMGVGLVTALGNQVAAAQARQETGESEIRDLVRSGMALATGAGVLGAFIMIGLGEALVWLGQDAAIVAQAKPMLLALAPGLLPCLWFQAIRQFTVGMRRPKALVWITVGSVGVNAALNLAFIYGLGPFPRLGLPGIGLSTTLVYLLSFVALYAMTKRDEVLAPMLSLRAWRARGENVRRLTRVGVPIAATYGSEAGFFSVVALLMGSFGAAALAAHTVVNQLVYIVFQVTIGISHASSLSVSGALAVGETSAARRVSRIALVHGAIVMAIVGLVYLAAPGLVLRAFFDPAETAAYGVAATLLLVAAGLQFFDCAQNIGVGLLRGLDDTAAGFRLTLVGYWLVGLPAAWLIGTVAGGGPVGVWLGLLSGLAVTAALLLRRFTRSLAARGRPVVA